MARLIDDILAFSRTARREMAASVIDMTGLVQATFSGLAPAMAGRNIEVKVVPLPQSAATREMMERVWTNLLDNAIKFTGHKENARIEVGSYSEAGSIVYFVKDNGAGFDMRYVDKLFGVFQRLHKSEDFPGTGAGLAIVKQIIDRHERPCLGRRRGGWGDVLIFALPLWSLRMRDTRAGQIDLHTDGGKIGCRSVQPLEYAEQLVGVSHVEARAVVLHEIDGVARLRVRARLRSARSLSAR